MQSDCLQALRQVSIFKEHDDQRLGIRFVREDDGFDMEAWGRSDVVLPIVAALDPNGKRTHAVLRCCMLLYGALLGLFLV